jgi:hypothetical protein
LLSMLVVLDGVVDIWLTGCQPLEVSTAAEAREAERARIRNERKSMCRFLLEWERVIG